MQSAWRSLICWLILSERKHIRRKYEHMRHVYTIFIWSTHVRRAIVKLLIVPILAKYPWNWFHCDNPVEAAKLPLRSVYWSHVLVMGQICLLWLFLVIGVSFLIQDVLKRNINNCVPAIIVIIPSLLWNISICLKMYSARKFHCLYAGLFYIYTYLYVCMFTFNVDVYSYFISESLIFDFIRN